MIKKINEGFDPEFLDLEELIQLVTSNVELLDSRFKEIESEGYDVDEGLTQEESWAFEDLNKVIVDFCDKYCFY